MGYTGHEAIGGVSMGLNHMNGRVQDAITGRFLSADPYIFQPGNTQGYNRYSYVMNNPLTFTDPSGFETCDASAISGIDRFGRIVCSDTIPEVTVTASRINDEISIVGNFINVFQFEDMSGLFSTGGGDGQVADEPRGSEGGSAQGGVAGQPQVKQSCPKVPTAPIGADVKKNIGIARTRNTTQVPTISTPYGPAPNASVFSGPRWFYSQVNYLGPWDYKTQNPPGTQMYTDFGNFNYGATGRAIGFSAAELLWGAGLAQLKNDLENGNSPQGLSTRFDNPDDAAPILAGIQFYDNNCH